MAGITAQGLIKGKTTFDIIGRIDIVFDGEKVYLISSEGTECRLIDYRTVKSEQYNVITKDISLLVPGTG